MAIRCWITRTWFADLPCIKAYVGSMLVRCKECPLTENLALYGNLHWWFGTFFIPIMILGLSTFHESRTFIFWYMMIPIYPHMQFPQHVHFEKLKKSGRPGGGSRLKSLQSKKVTVIRLRRPIFIIYSWCVHLGIYMNVPYIWDKIKEVTGSVHGIDVLPCRTGGSVPWLSPWLKWHIMPHQAQNQPSQLTRRLSLHGKRCAHARLDGYVLIADVCLLLQMRK